MGSAGLRCRWPGGRAMNTLSGQTLPALAAVPGARWLAVRHETAYRYDTPVELAHHVAHLRPREAPGQTVDDWALDIDPAPDAGTDGPLAGMRDVWGNWRHAFSHSTVHDRLRVVSRFRARLEPLAPPDPGRSPPWERVAAALQYKADAAPGARPVEAPEFSLASPHVPRAPLLAAFATQVFTPGRPLMDAALALMHLIQQQFEYLPHSTTVATQALQALALRRGVCQDFAHVMIGALRSLGLAARYVSGYMLTQPAPGRPRLVGADASHAWVAVWCPTQGWVALDPTNAMPAGQDHVTVAWGRDYGDVAPLRGVIRGGGTAQPEVAVTVEPVLGG
jgi:transglutaminase-like putative cysteine protease